ncbi:MAG: aminotransferase class IV [Bryobacteraceae bacterium]|jgi:branched-chain amino acid aminotransferase
MHRFLLHNDQILDAGTRDLAAGQVGLLAGWGVFSTIRVAEGVLFAFERHWDRMRRDAKRLRVPFPADPEWMHGRLLRLVEANSASNATMRVVVVRNRGGLWQGPGVDRDFDLIAFTSNIAAWPGAVRLGVKPAARYSQSEFSSTKMLSWAQNLVYYEQARERGLDEYVLLNERGDIAECTSANIFAVFGNTVCTPPLSSGCLPGVTRALLLTEIKAPGLTTVERPLTPADIEKADQVLISSTTRDLLVVESIEGLTIRNEGHAGAVLEEALSAYRARYIQQHAHVAPLAGE